MKILFFFWSAGQSASLVLRTAADTRRSPFWAMRVTAFRREDTRGVEIAEKPSSASFFSSSAFIAAWSVPLPQPRAMTRRPPAITFGSPIGATPVSCGMYGLTSSTVTGSKVTGCLATCERPEACLVIPSPLGSTLGSAVGSLAAGAGFSFFLQPDSPIPPATMTAGTATRSRAAVAKLRIHASWPQVLQPSRRPDLSIAIARSGSLIGLKAKKAALGGAAFLQGLVLLVHEATRSCERTPPGHPHRQPRDFG